MLTGEMITRLVKLKIPAALLWILILKNLKNISATAYIERPGGPNKMDFKIYRSFLDF